MIKAFLVTKEVEKSGSYEAIVFSESREKAENKMRWDVDDDDVLEGEQASSYVTAREITDPKFFTDKKDEQYEILGIEDKDYDAYIDNFKKQHEEHIIEHNLQKNHLHFDFWQQS